VIPNPTLSLTLPHNGRRGGAPKAQRLPTRRGVRPRRGRRGGGFDPAAVTVHALRVRGRGPSAAPRRRGDPAAVAQVARPRRRAPAQDARGEPLRRGGGHAAAGRDQEDRGRGRRRRRGGGQGRPADRRLPARRRVVRVAVPALALRCRGRLQACQVRLLRLCLSEGGAACALHCAPKFWSSDCVGATDVYIIFIYGAYQGYRSLKCLIKKKSAVALSR